MKNLASCGIGDPGGVIAVLALGAEGVQMGTALLACEESGASALHRQALLERKAGHTALTKGFTFSRARRRGRARKTRTGDPQPLDGGVEPAGN